MHRISGWMTGIVWEGTYGGTEEMQNDSGTGGMENYSGTGGMAHGIVCNMHAACAAGASSTVRGFICCVLWGGVEDIFVCV